ncbi:hypothetical protein NPS01_31930 [Nocardioides psychrotolerans]|uniref:Uncharacterized protein n=2 Tax=Nocardioides psychrotolerans TaxID=1005945 RepID=A0A1I3P4Y3_9ACTN|nr:hypothetical protein NPS01_31930 [Nocardioides psychrotolerans]SFJ16387.1 hypothetical protein SAMN05216561_11981 [Nocardioides psychrotolerans]
MVPLSRAYPQRMSTSTDLQVRRRPRAGIILRVGLGLVVVAFVVWFTTSPAALPTSQSEVSASTPVSIPVYVGVFTPAADFDRRLHLSGVKVHTTANTPVTVTPLLCVGGTVGVTTEPERFCRGLVDPEGRTFGEGDAIVLEVSSPLAAIAVIDRVRLGFRDGLQRGTLEAGSGAIVRVLGR